MDNFISYLNCHGVHIENMQVITLGNDFIKMDVKIKDIDGNYIFNIKQNDKGGYESIIVSDGFKSKKCLSNIDLLKFLIFRVNK